MFQEVAQQIVQTEQAEQAITFIVAVKNAGIAALVAFGVLYATAYRRVGSDNFIFWLWLKANRNRWINGIVSLGIFSTIALLIPDISAASNAIGFNLNAKVPLSFGLALAAWLATTSKAKEPGSEDSNTK